MQDEDKVKVKTERTREREVAHLHNFAIFSTSSLFSLKSYKHFCGFLSLQRPEVKRDKFLLPLCQNKRQRNTFFPLSSFSLVLIFIPFEWSVCT
jgi:hypothetical protein